MTNYHRILKEFQEIGCHDTDLYDEYQINEKLDIISHQNINVLEFNRDVAAEVFEQTQKDKDNKVILKNYINTIIAAHGLLLSHIKESQNQLKNEKNGDMKIKLEQQIDQYKEDYRMLAQPFNIKTPFNMDQRGVESRVSNRSDLFSEIQAESQSSVTLQIILAIAIACFFVQLFLMFVKHHFLSMFSILLVLSIFLLNYFDGIYIKITIFTLVINVLLDFFWICLQADTYWSATPQTVLSTLQPGYLRFVYIMTLIEMLAKCVIIGILYKFINNNKSIRKSVKLLNLRFELSGQDNNNPFSEMWRKRV